MKSILILVLVFVFFAKDSFCYHEGTHTRITLHSINEIEQLISSKLIKSGISNGLNEQLLKGESSPKTPKIILHFIQNGGFMEDYPITSLRYKNHFYNPLNSSGLISSYPSYTWANLSANIDSWYYLRQSYFNGLTLETEEIRNNWLANAFGALGQVMHLVQDKSVPAHVRNDAHALPDPYEVFVEHNYSTLFDQTPIMYDGELGSEGKRAPKQLWDTDLYDGTNPMITLTPGIGLAEYTNANFVSKNTIFAQNILGDYNPFNHYFPYPRRSDTQILLEDLGYIWNGQQVYRLYFEKTGGGTAVKHLATVSRLYFSDNDLESNNIEPEFIEYGLDDKCHIDYAEKLIPRAVGYSAALLQYFFRGDIGLSPSPDSPDKLVLKNNSDEALSGDFEIYYDDAADKRTRLHTWSDIAIPANSQALVERFTLPAEADSSTSYLLVFHGKLGQEEGSVVANTVNLKPAMQIYGPVNPYERDAYFVYGGTQPYRWEITGGARISVAGNYGAMVTQLEGHCGPATITVFSADPSEGSATFEIDVVYPVIDKLQYSFVEINYDCIYDYGSPIYINENGEMVGWDMTNVISSSKNYKINVDGKIINVYEGTYYLCVNYYDECSVNNAEAYAPYPAVVKRSQDSYISIMCEETIKSPTALESQRITYCAEAQTLP